MSDFEIGVTGFGVLLLLLAVRIPIGVAMISVGMVGYVTIAGPVALLSYLKTETYWRFTSDILSVVPLFILMGQFAAKAGLSQALFNAANVWLGHHRGGVAMAAVGGCAGFGYDWSFEDTPTDKDLVIDNILLIDKIYELYIFGMQLDYKNDIFGDNFIFNNPKA